MNSISGVQRRYTNQYSLPLGLSLLHLKLQPCSRQTVQHISWSQGRSTCLLISKSILQTSTPVWTMPDSMEKWIIRCTDDTGRLWKTTKYCKRAKECIKVICLDSWEYWYAAWRGSEHGKSDEWISADMERDHRIWIS